jgi:hypothetical protein
VCARISEAAGESNDLRERWLAPEWIEQVAAEVDAADDRTTSISITAASIYLFASGGIL